MTKSKLPRRVKRFPPAYHIPRNVSPQSKRDEFADILKIFVKKGVKDSKSIPAANNSINLSQGTQEINDTNHGQTNQESKMEALHYYYQELAVDKLNDIHQHLWMAGREENIRPLHRQHMLGREIRITEDSELHLVWRENTIFIKPLPPFLIDQTFWKLREKSADEHASPITNPPPGNDPSISENTDKLPKWKDLEELAYGFIKSYSSLIVHPSDFRIARKLGLLPYEDPEADTGFGFEVWFNFLHHRKFRDLTKDDINKRYHYGELRLPRLNTIYRFTKARFFSGYFRPETTYNLYFQRFWPLVIFIFAFFSIVLGALQVLLQANGPTSVLSNHISLYFVAVTLILCLLIASAFFFAWLGMNIQNGVQAMRKGFKLNRHKVPDIEDRQPPTTNLTEKPGGIQDQVSATPVP